MASNIKYKEIDVTKVGPQSYRDLQKLMRQHIKVLPQKAYLLIYEIQEAMCSPVI